MKKQNSTSTILAVFSFMALAYFTVLFFKGQLNLFFSIWLMVAYGVLFYGLYSLTQCRLYVRKLFKMFRKNFDLLKEVHKRLYHSHLSADKEGITKFEKHRTDIGDLVLDIGNEISELGYTTTREKEALEKDIVEAKHLISQNFR